MDIIDSADEINELNIKNVILNRSPIIKSINGLCIWCEELPVATNSTYCSKDCGDDHEQYKRKNG